MADEAGQNGAGIGFDALGDGGFVSFLFEFNELDLDQLVGIEGLVDGLSKGGSDALLPHEDHGFQSVGQAPQVFPLAAVHLIFF
jgi:hypothetical protein